MKKIISLLLSLLIIFSLASCSNKEDTTVSKTQVANPMTEYSSLEEINNEAGVKLAHPGVMGVSDEKFFIYDISGDKLAEYKFKVNGIDYIFRGANMWDHDISGYYINAKLAFEDMDGDAVDFASDKNAKLARWYTLDGQYVLTVKDNGAYTQEQFNGIANEMLMLSSTWMGKSNIAGLFEGLNGQYFDNYSQRATASIETSGTSAKMKVNWSNSAFETYVWEMTLYLSEDSLLYYTDGSLKAVTLDGETTKYMNKAGYFNYSGDTLYWNGAPDSDCLNCQFVRQ